MSRASTASQRNLTLTEELEKLEQSITLTLQEIDHNFSRAHRIVTTSILPIVEQYAEHSKEVWEGSKFWKQFFEASANVSLSGYEEVPVEEETVTDDTTSQATPFSSAYASPGQQEDSTSTPGPNHHYESRAPANNSSPFSTPSHSTPQASHANKPPPTIASYSSPYENLRREVVGTHNDTTSPTPSSTLPSTPRNQDDHPESSPFLPPSTAHNARTPANDILLHRILDRNYRLQATPHTVARLPKHANGRPQQTPLTANRRTRFKATNAVADDLDSSPAVPAPELHAEIFDSPARAPRVPGVSVLTPAKKVGGNIAQGVGKTRIWDSDSDDEDDGLPEGMSPPKTMQFHIPQSKLLKTPAREASKRIVEDLLLTAGGNMTDDLEDSPSVVKRGGLLEDDTF